MFPIKTVQRNTILRITPKGSTKMHSPPEKAHMESFTLISLMLHQTPPPLPFSSSRNMEAQNRRMCENRCKTYLSRLLSSGVRGHRMDGCGLWESLARLPGKAWQTDSKRPSTRPSGSEVKGCASQWNAPFEVLQHPASILPIWKLPLKLRQRLIKPQMNRSLHCHKHLLSSARLQCSGSSLLEKHRIQLDISAANLFAEYLL